MPRPSAKAPVYGTIYVLRTKLALARALCSFLFGLYYMLDGTANALPKAFAVVPRGAPPAETVYIYLQLLK
jgi:hypothetical protein